jgi:hypothetical protein
VLGARPVFEAGGMAFMMPDHLLQENDVSIKCPQAIAQLMHHHAAFEMRNTFMDVVCCDMQRVKHIAKNCLPGSTGDLKI